MSQEGPPLATLTRIVTGINEQHLARAFFAVTYNFRGIFHLHLENLCLATGAATGLESGDDNFTFQTIF